MSQLFDDAIELDFLLAAIVGILPRERLEPQPMRIRLRMELDLERTAQTGDLSASVDYGALDEAARFVAIEGRFLLLETLASTLLKMILLPPGPGEARAQVARASVRIEKPAVLLASTPSVSLRREAAWAHASGECVDLALLPEVTVRRWALQTGHSPEATGALLGLGGATGRLSGPFVASGPCTVLQVVRR